MRTGLDAAQLNASFMATSLLGFVLSLVFVLPESPSWGIAFSLTFLIMFISSVISMEKGPVELANEYASREKRLREEIEKEEKTKGIGILNVSKMREKELSKRRIKRKSRSNRKITNKRRKKNKKKSKKR